MSTANDIEKTIARNIRNIRTLRDFTQDQLAIRCNMSNSTISRFENCESIPNAVQLKLIASALGVNVGELYDETVTPKDALILHRFSGDMTYMKGEFEILVERIDDMSKKYEQLISILNKST